MIYVNQKQLEQVEYLIEQSSRGHHVLFETDMIRRAFLSGIEIPTKKSEAKTLKYNTSSSLSKYSSESVVENLNQDPSKEPYEELSTEIEKHIENLILQPTLLAKRAYLENLESKTFIKVVKTYFSIVENNLQENNKFTQ